VRYVLDGFSLDMLNLGSFEDGGLAMSAFILTEIKAKNVQTFLESEPFEVRGIGPKEARSISKEIDYPLVGDPHYTDTLIGLIKPGDSAIIRMDGRYFYLFIR
jgi:hypothetical protein